MTTNPTKTRLNRIAVRRAEDRASARAANQLDERAERLMRADPHLAPDLAKVLTKVATRARLRGLFQHALRSFARTHAAHNHAARQAHALHRQADALYWGMVMGWIGLIERDASFYAGVWATEYEEARSRLLLSWYESALRFMPDCGASYDRWAKFNELAQRPCCGPPDPLVYTPRNKVGKGLTSLVYIEDEQRSGDGPWADKAEPVDEQADNNMRFAMVLDGLDALSDRERFAIVERYFASNEDGTHRTLDDVGKMIGRSRECIRSREFSGIAKLKHYAATHGLTCRSTT